MNYRTKIVAAALCGTVLSTPALAQDASTDGQIDGESELLGEDMDVIIVTATKRAQDVQQIPLAVTAVSPARTCPWRLARLPVAKSSSRFR